MTETRRALSERQRDDCRRDGFVVIPGVFSAAEAAQHGRWIDELAARPPEVGRQMVYFEDSVTAPGSRVLSRIEKFVKQQ